MTIKQSYAECIRAELDRYAVWDPGNQIHLGDYGVLRDKTFDKRGNIREFNVEFNCQKSPVASYQFTNAGTSVMEYDLNGTTGAATEIQTSLEYTFLKKRGIVINDAKSQTEEISNLAEMAEALFRKPAWDRKFKIVSMLRTVASATILMSNSRNRSVKIKGTVEAIRQLKSGSLKADTGITVTGDVGLKMIGVRGPLFLDLIEIDRVGEVSRGNNGLRGVFNFMVEASPPEDPYGIDPSISGVDIDAKPFRRVPADISVNDDE